MTRWIVTLCLIAFASSARAEIWAWQDANGVRRFTNHKELIPEEYQEHASVLVRDFTLEPDNTNEPPVLHRKHRRAIDEEEPAPRQVQIVYDQPPPSADYLRGVVDGMDMRSDRAAQADVIQVAPVVVAPTYSAPPWLRYAPGPLVTTGFDQGRYRHRTLRMALQDEFQGSCSSLDPWGATRLGTVPFPTLIVQNNGRLQPPRRGQVVRH